MLNSKFYTAFYPLRNKERINKRSYRTINNTWDEVGGRFKEDYMLFDIDDKDVNANLFFDLKDMLGFKAHITESEHGIHAIFKKPKEIYIGNRIHAETITGIICDYKGYGNSYERFIVDRKPLEVIEWCDEPYELPFVLFPYNLKPDLQGVEEGDGRHAILGALNNIYARYCSDPKLILQLTNWVNDNVFKEARDKVNWSIKDVMDSIQYYNRDNLKLDDVLTKYEIDNNKLINYIVRTFKLKS